VLAPAAALLARAAHAQAWPARPIRLIVPFAVGGSGDLVGRLVAEKLANALGQSVIVDNRGGNGSILGTGLAARAAPDGYTLVLSNGAAITTGPLIGQQVPYQPLKDFTHIALLGTFTNALIVRADHPARNLAEFLAMARARPGKISYGSAGVGSAGFLTGELLKQLAGIDIVHIPYKGTSPALTELLGGQLDAMFNALIAAAPHIKAGKVRALAIASSARDPGFPDIPTMAETVSGAVGDAWFGLSGPAQMPAPVVERLHAEVVRLMGSNEVKDRLVTLGLLAQPLGPKAFTAFIEAENRKWAPVIRSAHIKPE
jgi:tripartite-type tricarboxylate transporter receptor subunit TctC